MRRLALSVGALAVAGMSAGAARADDPSMSPTATAAEAQARQVGMFVGGTASQYDLCAKKGFLAVAKPSAEETAKSLLEKIAISSGGVDQSVYVQQGWDMMKKEIAEHESFYTQERCTAVGKEWAKMMAAKR
jgi:hypothetical protein